MYDALIGLGSNIGDKAGNISKALELLQDSNEIKVERISRFYKSSPWGVHEQDWFVNAVAAITTKLDALTLLQRCLGVETRMGRVREMKWGPRVIDLDLLTYRDQTIETEILKLPHPHIEKRSFVLVPLLEIAPHQKIRGEYVSTLLSKISSTDVVPIEHT